MFLYMSLQATKHNIDYRHLQGLQARTEATGCAHQHLKAQVLGVKHLVFAYHYRRVYSTENVQTAILCQPLRE